MRLRGSFRRAAARIVVYLSSTGHVGLHLFHILSRFERDPTRVEGDRLADEHDRAVVFVLGSVVLENNELRRFVAASRPQVAHPCRVVPSPFVRGS